MKKIFIMMMLFAPLSLFAQKFGHVDTQAVIQSLPEFSKANGEIEALGKQFENELKASQDELQRLADEYDRTKSTMNATKQQETEASLQEKYQRIQEQAQQNQQEFQKKQQELLQPIFTKVRSAIEAVGQAGGYTYIQEVGSVLYINPTLSKDVTADVKAQLNKMK